MYDHSVELPHNINPGKAVARFTESGANMKEKYEDNDVTN
jgi:hypothetical protein